MASHEEMKAAVGRHIDNLDSAKTIGGTDLVSLVGGQLDGLAKKHGVGADTFREVLGKMKPGDEKYQEVLNSVTTIRNCEAQGNRVKNEFYEAVANRVGSKGVDQDQFEKALSEKDSAAMQRLIGESFSRKEKFGRLFSMFSPKKMKVVIARDLLKEYDGREKAAKELTSAKENASTLLSYTLLQDETVKESLHRRALGITEERSHSERTESQPQQSSQFPTLNNYLPLLQFLAMQNTQSQNQGSEGNNTLNLVLQLLLFILRWKGERAMFSMENIAANDNKPAQQSAAA